MAYNPYYFTSDSEDSEGEDDVEMASEYSSSAQSTTDVSMSNGSESSRAKRGLSGSSTASSSSPLSDFSGNQSNATSVTSHDPMASAGSRTPSPGPSVLSISESIRDHIYREEYGREINNYSEVYKMPADEEEFQRQDKQHRMFIDIFGGKYPPPMWDILASNVMKEKKVLDLGCGNGAWIMDVARDFPFCEAVAVDLVPLPAECVNFSTHVPAGGIYQATVIKIGEHCTTKLEVRAKSEVDDINMGLQHFYNQFDVVNARLISSGIKDYRLLIERISRVVRPGGMIQLSEYDITSYDRYRKRIPVNASEPLGAPWWARVMAHINKAVRISGGDVDAATHLLDWVSNHPAFENVVYKDVWLPVVPGNDQMYDESVYTRLRDDVMVGVRSARPLLLGTGLSEHDFDILEHNTEREINQSSISQYTRLQCVYATKRHGIILPHLPGDRL